MTLPADATKVHMDSAADDPKQARAELADLVDKFNALIDHLQLSVITNDPLAIGQGIESDGAGNLRVKLDGATIARSASGIKVAASQLGVGNFANITANRVIGSSGAGVVGEISASEGLQIASSVAKLNINGLTAETTLDSTTDYIAFYDDSAGAHRKATLGALGAVTQATKQDTTSGTTIDFTGIPAGVKWVDVMLSGVSTGGTSALLIQIGDAGGIEATGYSGTGSQGAAHTSYTAGFGIRYDTASYLVSGILSLALIDAATNTWAAAGVFSAPSGPITLVTAGSKALSATLDRVRLTSVSSDTFDAGMVNIQYGS